MCVRQIVTIAWLLEGKDKMAFFSIAGPVLHLVQAPTF